MADDIEDDFSSIGIPTNATRPNGASSSKRTNSTAKPTAALDRSSGTSNPTKAPVVQPEPQALPKRSGPASIIVSPRQKGNPILTNIKSLPWEYGDIPADYVLGATACALFLSLKYHRLHPEYIYTRIRNLQGKYNLRLLLCMVDIPNHEDALKELAKTSLINNVTLMLCWSAAEGGRYLELFKTYENAAPTAIKQHQSTSYGDRMIDFVTTPRSINKTDAVSLVSQFGTVRTAVNARFEEVATIAGWGEKKVQRWCRAVREPFRVQRAARRGVLSSEVSRADGSEGERWSATPGRGGPVTAVGDGDADRRPHSRLADEVPLGDAFADDEEALAETLVRPPIPPKKVVENVQEVPRKRKPEDDPLDEGVMAALSKLRKAG